MSSRNVLVALCLLLSHYGVAHLGKAGLRDVTTIKHSAEIAPYGRHITRYMFSNPSIPVYEKPKSGDYRFLFAKRLRRRCDIGA
ncbi:hypothetical protein GGI35DRAFT_360887 [Trichoderma velutinum]